MRISRHHRRPVTASTGARHPHPASPRLVVPISLVDHGLGLWLHRRKAAGRARHAGLVLPEGWIDPPLGEGTGSLRGHSESPCWLLPAPVSEQP